MLDDGGAAEQIVVKVHGDDERLLIGAADRDRHRIDQRAVDQNAPVASDRLEHAGQGIGGAHRGDQRAVRQPDFVAGADFGGDADERLRQICEGRAVHVFLHARVELHAAEQAAAADVQIEQPEKPALGQAAGEFFQLVELAGQIAAADQRADRRAGDHADLDAGLVERTQHADMGPAARRAAAKRK